MKRFAAALAALVAVACGSPGSPAVGSPLSMPQLKFAVIDAVGAPVYCDPDYYPIVRLGGEEQNADTYYPQIRSDATLYAAIVAHEHLPSGELSKAQRLTLYRAFKLLRALSLTPNGAAYSYSVRVQVHNASAAYQLVSGTVRADGVVTVNSRTASGPPPCPICLAATSLIATPEGAVPVSAVRLGMLVWTSAPDGSRIAAPVILVGSIEVPPGHLMVHLVLADGRELLASPGHRTGDGRALGGMEAGDRLDGSTVAIWELVPYDGDRTYDLLPAGRTGSYWAGGILLSSTLA